MSKLLSLLKSKKFWTLVAAIVAALTAFFTVSCQYSGTLFRTGVHNDTVRVEYRVRSRNAVVSCNQPILTPESFRSTHVLNAFTPFVTSPTLSAGLSLGHSKTPVLATSLEFKRSCVLSTTSGCPISIVSNLNCSTNPVLLLNAPFESSGITCLASLLPLGFVKRSRRGGRRGKGRPRPSTKTVTLGGSHL